MPITGRISINISPDQKSKNPYRQVLHPFRISPTAQWDTKESVRNSLLLEENCRIHHQGLR